MVFRFWQDSTEFYYYMYVPLSHFVPLNNNVQYTNTHNYM